MNNSKIGLSSPHMGGSEQEFVKELFGEIWGFCGGLLRAVSGSYEKAIGNRQ